MMRWAIFLILLVSVVASSIAVVYRKQQHRQAFIGLTELERERDALNIEYGKLELEQGTLAETSRIERLARTQLKLHYPSADDVRMVAP